MSRSREFFQQPIGKTVPEAGDSRTRGVQNTSDRPQPRTEQVLPIFGSPEFTYAKPLVPPREVPVGGGRTIGGGTSREAQRRARKQLGRR
ncbi:MAG: hypothetical protein KA035_04050 [Candidatus Levybacteria bacterium]|nr:hypothetical protein [Candidatus Levybacteria bacterium]